MSGGPSATRTASAVVSTARRRCRGSSAGSGAWRGAVEGSTSGATLDSQTGGGAEAAAGRISKRLGRRRPASPGGGVSGRDAAEAATVSGPGSSMKS